jgi:HNH endonuclease
MPGKPTIQSACRLASPWKADFFLSIEKRNPLSWRYKQFFEHPQIRAPAKSCSDKKGDGRYYPFGLTMAGISDKALKSNYAENKYRFQKQELQNHEFSDGSGLEMYEFKYRFEDDQTGRFWSIDPLANDYVYNSPYAFSENKVTGHVELEGLEARSVISGEATGGISGWVATAMSGDAPATEGSGEAVAGAVGAFFSGAWHGMVKAYDMVFGSSPSAPTTTSTPGAPSAPTTTTTPGAPSAPTATTTPGAPNAPTATPPAQAPQAVHQATGLPAPGAGKGNTPADQRDPKRVWTKAERQQQLDKQNGKCAQCGAEKTVDETQGHHIVRHADGGTTTPDNHAEVCKECHVDLHKN